MARLVADSKMGYYPTPEKTLACITDWVHFGKKTYNILDPCCGEGLALGKIGSHNCNRWVLPPVKNESTLSG